MDCEGTLCQNGRQEVPTLDKYEARIAKVHAIETSVQAMPSIFVEEILHINARPLKQALVVYVSKWIHLYTNSLQQKVILKLKV